MKGFSDSSDSYSVRAKYAKDLQVPTDCIYKVRPCLTAVCETEPAIHSKDKNTDAIKTSRKADSYPHWGLGCIKVYEVRLFAVHILLRISTVILNISVSIMRASTRKLELPTIVCISKSLRRRSVVVVIWTTPGVTLPPLRVPDVVPDTPDETSSSQSAAGLAARRSPNNDRELRVASRVLE